MMRKFIPALCLFMALVTTTVSAQVCNGDVVLSTQEEVNAFDCEILEGDLHLVLSQNLDLEPLSLLTEVRGSILIDLDPDLDVYLTGLRNLIRAGGMKISASGGSSYDTRFDLSVFEHLDSLGELSVSEVRLRNSFPVLRRLNSLSMYASYFTDISWLENISPIHSLYLNTQVVADQNEALLAKINEGADLRLMYSNFHDLGGLTAIGYLNTLEITGSMGKSFDGLSSLDSTNYFLVSDTEVSEGCCGLAPYLRSDPQPIAFQFTGNSCSLDEILENCVTENVCEGDVIISNANDLLSFDCEVVQGNLTLEYGFFEMATLRNLKEITGDLIIRNLDYLSVSISDFLSLTSVGGSILIESNTHLGSIQGLSKLTHIGGDLIIRNNPRLTALGIFALEHVNNVEILNNPKLNYCCDVDRIIRENIIQGEVLLSENGKGCSIDYIAECPENASVCDGDIYVTNQYDVDKYYCEVIKGDLILFGPTGLNLDNLNTLREIKGGFNIQMDDLSFNGLQNLEKIGGTIRFSAFNYPYLSYTLFDLDPLVSLRSIGGFEIILSNLEGSLNLTEPIGKVVWGYASYIDDISWIENVPSIDTIRIENPGFYDSPPSAGSIPDLVSEGGILSISGIPEYSFNTEAWNQKTNLNLLEFYDGNFESLDFLSTIEKVNTLSILYSTVTTNEVCGAYNLLMNGEVGTLNWTGNTFIIEGQEESLTIQYILDNCAPEDVNSLSVYPNPSGDQVVKLSWQEKGEGNTVIQVLDNNGREVMRSTQSTAQGLQEAELNTTTLKPGFYLIRILSGGEVKLSRFVRQ